MIDLRSDTVTQPTPAMREAMYRAEVGDDVFAEDPTANKLQEMAAERMGKEAALLVASGTMANLVALLTHCQRGDEVILGDQSHTYLLEVGGGAALGGLHMRPLPNDGGYLKPEAVEAAIRGPNIHFPRTGLVCLENTHNRCGGAVLTPAQTTALAAVAHRHGIPLHLDGARIFNAAIYLGLPARELAAEAASVCFCLSKGLSAPVGSLLCGSRAFIERARHYRKMLGGGMRQVGIIAAAGIVALEQMVDRLAEDHFHARILAEGLSSQRGIGLDPSRVQTNIIIFELKHPRLTPADFVANLAREGVLAGNIGGGRIRMVTHYGIERRDIEEALAAVARVVA